jgi:hypothetical protein
MRASRRILLKQKWRVVRSRWPQQSAEALAAYQRAEIDKWRPLIRAANIKAE